MYCLLLEGYDNGYLWWLLIRKEYIREGGNGREKRRRWERRGGEEYEEKSRGYRDKGENKAKGRDGEKGEWRREKELEGRKEGRVVMGVGDARGWSWWEIGTSQSPFFYHHVIVILCLLFLFVIDIRLVWVLLYYLIRFIVFVFILNHICYNNHTVDTVCAAKCVTLAPMLTQLCCIAIIEIISVF